MARRMLFFFYAHIIIRGCPSLLADLVFNAQWLYSGVEPELNLKAILEQIHRAGA